MIRLHNIRNAKNLYVVIIKRFKLGVILQDLRKNEGFTQEALVNKCSITKSSMPRIENNASDIRLSRIFREEFGNEVKLTLN
jgi:HTH-type transcriptional regulator / antitoxin HipB